jgi:hypothetical protein
MEKYFDNVAHSPGRAPIGLSVSNITGLNRRTVASHLSKQAPIDIPRCCQPKIRITKQKKLEKVASRFEPFVQVYIMM